MENVTIYTRETGLRLWEARTLIETPDSGPHFVALTDRLEYRAADRLHKRIRDTGYSGWITVRRIRAS